MDKKSENDIRFIIAHFPADNEDRHLGHTRTLRYNAFNELIADEPDVLGDDGGTQFA